MVHCDVDTRQYEAFDDLHTQVDGRLKLLHVFLGVFAQHPVYLSATWIIVADAHAQSGIVLSDKLLDMSQSVVSAVASVGLQSESAERQGELIADDEQSASGRSFPDSASISRRYR